MDKLGSCYARLWPLELQLRITGEWWKTFVHQSDLLRKIHLETLVWMGDKNSESRGTGRGMKRLGQQFPPPESPGPWTWSRGGPRAGDMCEVWEGKDGCRCEV